MLHDQGFDFMEEDNVVIVFPFIDWELITASTVPQEIDVTQWKITDARKQHLVAEYLYDYYTALGLAYLTPYRQASAPAERPMSRETVTAPVPSSPAMQPFVDAPADENETYRPGTQATAGTDGFFPFTTFDDVLPEVVEAESDESPFE